MTSYTVVSTELRDAAANIKDLKSWAKKDMTELKSDAETVGHDGFAAAVGRFRDRWKDGLEILGEDLGTASKLLTEAATAYEKTDAAAADAATKGDG